MRDLAKNPFLILTASSDADMADLKQSAKSELMQLRLAGEGDGERHRKIERALESLQDNLDRFHWGLLWVELTPTELNNWKADSVLAGLEQSPEGDGFSAYEKICDTSSMIVRAHNLGVIGLLEATEQTRRAQVDTVDDITDDLECAELWKRAFTTLRFALNSEEFWMRKRLWAKSLDDPRLSEEIVRQIQADLPSEILQLSGDVIRRALLDRHPEVAKVYVDVVRESGYDDSEIDHSLSMVYAPLADRIRDAVSSLKTRLDEHASGSGDIADYKQLLYEFKADIAPDLDVMLAVGDLPGYAEEHARDTSAEFLRRLASQAWNTTSTTDLSKEAISCAQKYVDSGSLESMLSTDALQIQELDESLRAAKELAPYRKALERAMAVNDYVAAIAALEKLIPLESEPIKSQAQELRKTLKSAWSTQLYNRAIRLSNTGERDLAKSLLIKALLLESDPTQRAIVQRALDTLLTTSLMKAKKSSSGCMLILASGLLLGIMAGAVYAIVS